MELAEPDEVRWAWNWALGEFVRNSKLHYEAPLTGALPEECPPKPRWDVNAVQRRITQMKRLPKWAWLNDVPTCVITQKLRDLDTAFKNWFAGRARFPQFKRKQDMQSARFQLDQRHIAKNFIAGERLNLPVIGEVKLRWSRLPTGVPKMVTISRDAVGDVWASFACDEVIVPLPSTGKNVGLDLGIKTAIMTSDGIGSGPIQVLKQALRKLKKNQRILDRRDNGSARWEKQRKVVAKLHRRVADCRRDLQHQLTTALIRQYDGLCIEDLHVKGMLKNHKLARALADVGFGELRRQLEYKAEWYGRWVQPISRWGPSSKQCSGCGKKHMMTLGDRRMICECGVELDRDHNAALNILRAGLALRGAV